MGCVAMGIAVGVGAQGSVGEVLLRSQGQHHLNLALTRRHLVSYIDFQVANLNFVLMSRTLGGSGKTFTWASRGAWWSQMDRPRFVP